MLFFSLQYNSICRLRLRASLITIEEIKAVHKIGSILCSMQIHTSRPIKKTTIRHRCPLTHLTCNVSLDAEAGSRAGIMNRSATALNPLALVKQSSSLCSCQNCRDSYAISIRFCGTTTREGLTVNWHNFLRALTYPPQ